MPLLAIQGAAALAQVGLVLLLGAGAVVGLGRLRRRAGGGRALPLTPQHAVHLVEVEGRRILVGTGPAGAPRFLCELDPARQAAPPSSPRLARLRVGEVASQPGAKSSRGGRRLDATG